MPKFFALLTLFILFSSNTAAQQTLKIVVGLSKPPYVIKESESGFEIELIQQVLNSSGQEPEFIFVPYGRSEKILELSGVSAVMTVNKQIFPNNAFLSDSYISYQNVAISLKKNNFTLNTIADIGHYSIASFQSAHKILGTEFAKAAANSPLFTQVANQEKQVKMLLLGRVEVLIIDSKIFLYYLNKLNMQDKLPEISFHQVFPPNPYRIAFKDKAKMNEFNQAFAIYKNTDNYQKLLKKYNF